MPLFLGVTSARDGPGDRSTNINDSHSMNSFLLQLLSNRVPPKTPPPKTSNHSSPAALQDTIPPQQDLLPSKSTPFLSLATIPFPSLCLALVPDLVDHVPFAVELGLVIDLAFLFSPRLPPVAPLYPVLIRRPALIPNTYTMLGSHVDPLNRTARKD